MQETQIKVEYSAFGEVFPIFIKLLCMFHKINLRASKFQKNKAVLTIKINKEERYEFIEKFYQFNNFFNIQKIEYEY